MSHEICIVDSSDRDRKSIGGYFRREGFLVAETGDAREAHALVRDKFYPVILVDADTEPWGGLEFVAFVRANSPRSEVILLTRRRSWDLAVGGYRAGVADVVYKDRSEAQRLREQVDLAVRRAEARVAGEASLPSDARALMDEMLRRMVELTGRIPDVQARLASTPAVTVRVAVVDHEPAVHDAVEEASRSTPGGGGGFGVSHLPSGGAALDALSAAPPDVLVVRDDLMDLPGTMVLGALGDAADAVALLYRLPGPGGEATVFERGHPVRHVQPIGSAADLVREVRSLCATVGASADQRRIMDLFRLEHADLIRRYATLRARLQEAIQRGTAG